MRKKKTIQCDINAFDVSCRFDSILFQTTFIILFALFLSVIFIYYPFSLQFYVLLGLIKLSAGFVFHSYVSDFSLASETIKMETLYNSLTLLITHMFLIFLLFLTQTLHTNTLASLLHYSLMQRERERQGK